MASRIAQWRTAWVGGLILGVVLLLAPTPVVSRDAQWIHMVSVVFGVVMAGNALGHLGASVYWGRLAPGVYSSPLLLIAAVALLVTASRARVQMARHGAEQGDEADLKQCARGGR